MAMSGGVDSSVAAALLLRANHEVIGVFMRHGEHGSEAETACASTKSPGVVTPGLATLPIVHARADHKQGCCSASDAEDARRVAQRLDIPFYALNLSDDFARIIDYFVEEYTAARTPNPCVVCNHWVKFGKLFEYADSVGAEFVATGHYARIAPSTFSRRICPALLRGLDDGKDQSYVLFGVAQHYLPRMMLPIGDYRKSEIRELAHELGLRVADKPDSQEICFVTSGDHAQFVRDHRNGGDAADMSGEIVLTDGAVVGHHSGIEAFTIGQRKGLGVALGEPHYVTRIEADTRRVVIGRHEELARRELFADRCNWLIDTPTEPFRALVQIRYNSSAAPALVEPLSLNRFRVQFDEPRHGVAPGQAAVCYADDQVLGGGWIE
jgi:tRNA-specific 2-thiouridylase